MSKQKQQHYIPRFYLNGFVNQANKIFIYDKKRNDIREQKPENVAKRNHYYCFEYQDGRRDFGVEELLGAYEKKASSVIDELKETNTITQLNQERLSIFLGFLAVRTPRFQKDFNKNFDESMKKMLRGNIKTSVKECFNERHEEYQFDFDSLSRFIESDDYIVNADRNESIKAMLKWSVVNGQRFYSRNWSFFKTNTDEQFITSDAPLYPIPKVTDTASSMVAFGFPLTKNIYLYIDEACGDEINVYEIDQDFCNSLNKWTMLASDEAVFASDRSLIEELF